MSRSRKDEVVKTKSSQLRAVYFLLWKQKNEGFVEFEDYYDAKMDLLLEYYKKILKKLKK